jgi:hypothetical protein
MERKPASRQVGRTPVETTARGRDRFWKPVNFRTRRDTGVTWMLLQSPPVALIDTEKLVFRVIIGPPAFKTEILIL